MRKPDEIVIFSPGMTYFLFTLSEPTEALIYSHDKYTVTIVHVCHSLLYLLVILLVTKKAKYEKDIIQSVTQATRKKFRVPTTGSRTYDLRTPVGRSTTELQDTRGSLEHEIYHHFNGGPGRYKNWGIFCIWSIQFWQFFSWGEDTFYQYCMIFRLLVKNVWF